MPRADHPNATILELERAGYSHVQIECADCGHETLTSFLLMRARGFVTLNSTFAQLTRRIRCAKCRRKPAVDSVRPVRRSPGASAAMPKKTRRDSL